MKTILAAAASLSLWAVGASGAAHAATCSPRREPTELVLPGFRSRAEIVMPPAGITFRGLVVLFPGSDVADMDGAIEGARDAIVSRPMRQVADRLACAGLASFRYNKRFVTGSMQADRERFDRLNGSDFAADGRAALAFARARAQFARVPLALVGWSEGTTVALAVASAEPDVRALVLMAPVVDTPARVAQAQYQRIGKPYLIRYATDGALDADAIARADAGPGGILAHLFVRMFCGFRPGERVNPLLDTNKDGRIGFAEADPIIASWYEDKPDSGLGMSATGRALTGLAAAYADTTPPLLLMQGLNDSMIGPGAVRAFAAGHVAGGRVTLRVYPGLGHSLGVAASAQDDALLPVAAKPLDDMAAWLRRTLGRVDNR